MYKLRDWVDETRLENSLSRNVRAVEYLETHKHLIDNYWIFENENAVHIIEKKLQNLSLINFADYVMHKGPVVNMNKNAANYLRNNRCHIDYLFLCGREHGIEFVDELIKNNELHKITWRTLSENPAAMHILNDPIYYQYIEWRYIIYNKNAAELVKNNLHMVNDYWDIICMQPHLIDIIECNMDKIDWAMLSCNYNAIHILEQHMDKIDWAMLSCNYNVIHILEQHMDKINMNRLFYNKNGFDLLLHLHHNFNNNDDYHENTVFEYFDYCEKNNIQFNLIRQLSWHGYSEKHMEFLKHTNNYYYLSMNPNIFEYDYKRMRETRQSLLWYNDIKK
jgi:hypothetical protein